MTHEEFVKKMAVDMIENNYQSLQRLKTHSKQMYCRGLVNMACAVGVLDTKELDEWTEKIKGVKTDD